MGTNPLPLGLKAGRDSLSSMRRESIIDWSWISTQVEELGMGRWVGIRAWRRQFQANGTAETQG